jgi:hypothetical protein
MACRRGLASLTELACGRLPASSSTSYSSMRFPADVRAPQVRRFVDSFFAIVPAQDWKARANWVFQQRQRNRFLWDFLVERHGLVLEMDRFLLDLECRGETALTESANPERYELIAFITTVARAFHRLSIHGQNRLRGMIRDGLNSDHSLVALQHEIVVAAHLRRRKFEVEFRDMERGGGADYLATRGSTRVEVECKMISGDIGRPIKARHAAEAVKAIFDAVATQRLSTSGNGHVLHVRVGGALSASQQHHAKISADVLAGAQHEDSTT